MNRIENDEIFRNLNEFLKAKGIELKDGSYPRVVQKSCQLLTDTLNLSKEGLEKAKTEVEKKLDQVRQVIHEKTAPKQPVNVEPAPTQPAAGHQESRAPKAAKKAPLKAGPRRKKPARKKASS